MSADIVHLGPHERMTTDEVFAASAREPWDDVMVIGFHKDGSLAVRSSHMSREFALWIVEHAKLHIMDRLEPDK